MLTQLLTAGAGRLITVTGLSGVGKSRLVWEVVGALNAEHLWPVAWVSHPGLGQQWPSTPIGEWFNRALNGSAVVLDDLADFVLDRRALLVIDGYGGMLELYLDAVHALLNRCPGLRIVLTSLVPLRIPEEQVYPLMPLAVPDPVERNVGLEGYSSVQMLISQLRQVRPDLVLDPALAGAVGALCHRLDGMPRALEFAAEWCRVRSPLDLLAELTRGSYSLSAPPKREQAGPDIVEAVAQSVATLSIDELDVLADLVDLDGSWSVDEAAMRTRRTPAVLASVVYVMLLCGLVRCRHGDRRNRFELLNVVRSAYRSVHGVAA